MNYSSYYLSNLEIKQWQLIFKYILEKSEMFTIHMWKDLKEKDKIFYNKLNEVNIFKVVDWEGGKGFIEITGNLDNKTKDFFINYINDSINENGYLLWDFQFIIGDRIALYVGDYDDKIITLTDLEKEKLKTENVGFESWNPLDNSDDFFLSNIRHLQKNN